jgi:NhaA family Na+:H+ antiporter
MNNEATVLPEVSGTERRWLIRKLHDETVGGLLLATAAVLAMLWANSKWVNSYEALTQFKIGPESLHLHLTLTTWSADFLLAIFFYVVGCELKHELAVGSLSNPRVAAVPIGAAIGGMLVAASIFLYFNYGNEAQSAWGIPISTDVAFSLAVLAIAGSKLPVALRSFLLTLAVVNDLGAILAIAIFYSHGFEVKWFLVALVLLTGFGVLQSRKIASSAIYIPLALLIWYAMFRSGIHATIAGVAMGLLMRAKVEGNEEVSPSQLADEKWRPLSAGFAVPVFALLASGVNVSGISLSEAFTDPFTVGVLSGLVIGQPLGVTLGAFLVARFTKGTLNPELSWWDVVVVGTLASVGFTVALLITEVTFASDLVALATGKFAIVFSLLAAIIVSVVAISIRSAFIGKYQVQATK